jgi:fructokinase
VIHASLAIKTPKTRPRPKIIGSGLLALDIVSSEVSGEHVRFWAGGTCGNVLIALAFLGWESQPVARLRTGAAADRILSDLKEWGVSNRFISTTEDGSTPVILERIAKGPGRIPRHSFSWRCPECGSQFPGFKPVLSAVAEEIAQQTEPPKVFFFDRATPGGIALARAWGEKNALVVFEPSSIGNPVLFRQAWRASHVVKYSHDRLRELPEVGVGDGPCLLVETLGSAGLRFRKLRVKGQTGRWVELKAFPVEITRDTAGSGDWCTAGLIEHAAHKGASAFFRLSDEELTAAFRYGQALAAWNCGFEGARGGMYAVDRAVFRQQVRKILKGGRDNSNKSLVVTPASSIQVEGVCTVCVRTEEKRLTTGSDGPTVTTRQGFPSRAPWRRPTAK